MTPTPSEALSWWDVVDRAGLIGLLLAQVGLGWWWLFKYGKRALDHWAEWITAIKELNKKLGDCE